MINKEKMPLPMPAGSCWPLVRLFGFGGGPPPPYLFANLLTSSRVPSILGIPLPPPASAFNLKLLPTFCKSTNNGADTGKVCVRKYGESFSGVRNEGARRENGREQILDRALFEKMLLKFESAGL